MLYLRKSKRLETAVPLRLMLLGMTKPPPAIETVTTNISSLGISMQLQVTLSDGVLNVHEAEKPVNLIPYLVLEKKEIAFELLLPPHDDKIKGWGQIAWYDFSTKEDVYYFKAGIFIQDIHIEDRKKWSKFIKDTSLMTGKLWHYIQNVSACIFIAGIAIFFIAGFGYKFKIAEKTGFFISLIGLIGFIIGWWRHRSFMLFRKFHVY